MSGVYIDTSALGRVLLGERAASVEAALDPFSERMSSRLLAVELRRLAGRCRRTGEAERLLDATALVPIDLTILSATELLLPYSLGTLDALHLATALRLAGAGRIGALLTYDRALAAASEHHGLEVLSP